MNNIREFTLNNTCFKETIFNGYYITQNGDINKNGKLKKFLVVCPQYEKEKNIINIVGRKLMNINRLSKR